MKTKPLLPAVNSPNDLLAQQVEARGRVSAYKAAGRSENTEKTYAKATDDFLYNWGGFLPTGERMVEGYISWLAGRDYAVSTIKLRLAAIAEWHRTQGHPDPTKGAGVKRTLAGIAKAHNRLPRQATPIAFDHLKMMVAHLENAKAQAWSRGAQAEYLQCSRNLAFLLTGFWRGFRSDELSRMEVKFVTVYKGVRIEVFLPYSKTDREGAGKTYRTQALRAYCPVEAYCRWIEDAGLVDGFVFRKVDRWGTVSESGLNPRSFGPLLNQIAADAGVKVHFSTHSMRHGFASWAADMNWDIKSVMSYVGWKNVDNAMRYMPERHDFGDLALAPSLNSSVSASVKSEVATGLVVAESISRTDN